MGYPGAGRLPSGWFFFRGGANDAVHGVVPKSGCSSFTMLEGHCVVREEATTVWAGAAGDIDLEEKRAREGWRVRSVACDDGGTRYAESVRDLRDIAADQSDVVGMCAFAEEERGRGVVDVVEVALAVEDHSLVGALHGEGCREVGFAGLSFELQGPK